MYSLFFFSIIFSDEKLKTYSRLIGFPSMYYSFNAVEFAVEFNMDSYSV